MTTDREWEKWGTQDPYFSVLTHPKYRAAEGHHMINLQAAEREELLS